MKLGNSKLVYWIWITLTKKSLLPFPLMTFLFDVCNTMIQDQRTAQTHPKNQPFFMSPNRKMLLTEKVHNIILDISSYLCEVSYFSNQNSSRPFFLSSRKVYICQQENVIKKPEFRSEFCQKNQMASSNLWQCRPIVNVKSVDKTVKNNDSSIFVSTHLHFLE